MTNRVLAELVNIAGWPTELGEQIKIVGADPVMPTRFRVGELAAGVHAACGMAVAYLWRLRTGRQQQVKVDLRQAAATFEHYLYLQMEKPFSRQPFPFGGFFPTKDERWFYLHGSFGNSPTRTYALKVLQCEENNESAAAAIRNWEAQSLEDALADAGCCGAIARSADEWVSHPQGQIIGKLPIVEIIKIGNSEPMAFPDGDRPLAGVRVLDLTRVLAGPTCGRTLAEHGADVLRVDSPSLPQAQLYDVDTGHGKRSTFIDFSQDSGIQTLWSLIRNADVFCQSYRLGTMDKWGFSPEALDKARRGIIYCSINCYGHYGTWRERRGWEQLAQTVSGIAQKEGEPGPPQLAVLPVSDYCTGYLAAFGTLVALSRRALEGGSYHVRVSLAQSAMLLNRLGLVPESAVDMNEIKEKTKLGRMPHLPPEESSKITVQTDTPYGKVTHLTPIVQLSETPARWTLPTVPLGTHQPVWLD